MESDVETWLEERFGARDERLLTDPDIGEELAAAREELPRRIEAALERAAEHEATYEAAIEAGAETDDEAERNEQKRRAKRAKRQYRRRTATAKALAERLGVVLVVEALREFDEMPPPGRRTREAVRERLAERPAADALPPGGYLDAARTALELDGDPLRPPVDTGPPAPIPEDEIPDAVDVELEVDEADEGDDEIDLDLDEEIGL